VPHCSSPNLCACTNYTEPLTNTYICGGTRLRPKVLPTKIQLGTNFKTYDRFGGICPGDFLKKWINALDQRTDTYPGSQGFQLDVDKKPIEGIATLETGVMVDRFDPETGGNLSPAGAPFVERSLPPNSLTTLPGKPV
jgi:hypothetical protein